jgi:hypothetical protein
LVNDERNKMAERNKNKNETARIEKIYTIGY